ncbi:MAG TPA: FeoC-like transcriptional regulator [Pantanalinema sp.]
MLKELLGAIRNAPTSSNLELRIMLGLSRETYEQLLAHLIRMGYVEAQALEVADASCASGSCASCPIACQSSPAMGPRNLVVTAKGDRYLAKPSP